MTFYDFCIKNNKQDFLDAWSNKNTFAPDEISYGSKKKAIFVCPVCGYETEKTIHDLRTVKKFSCKECNKKNKEKLEQTNKNKVKTEKIKKNRKNAKEKYIPISSLKYKANKKQEEILFVAQITTVRKNYKKDKTISSISLLCTDIFSHTSFIIRKRELLLKDFQKDSYVVVKCKIEKTDWSYELDIIDINEITENVYNKIEEKLVLNREQKHNSALKQKEKAKKSKEEKEKYISQLPFEKKYLMIDVETNGLNSQNDDLLEIAIYKPDTKTFFHKLLPLTKQSKVLTTEFNGITTDMLKNATHLTEEDMKVLVDEFEIEKRILLHFGTLDAPFLKQYLKSRKLINISNLMFFNFKHMIYSSKWSSGSITKDNLCNALEINGVRKVHDCQNDCLLQWQLFEKMGGKPWLITNNINSYDIYEYNNNYYIPASFFNNYSRLQNLINYKFGKMKLKPIRKVVSIPLSNSIKKYSPYLLNYFIGDIFERQINNALETVNLNKESYLLSIQNKSVLKKIGSFEVKSDIMFYSFNQNGTVNVLGDKDKKEEVSFLSKIATYIVNLNESFGNNIVVNTNGIFIEDDCIFDFSIFPNIEIVDKQDENLDRQIIVYGNNNLIIEQLTNKFIELLSPSIQQFADKIKSEIFRNQIIYTQEAVKNDKTKTFALCDFSNQYAIMEVKSTDDWNNQNYAKQCYIQSIGKPFIERYKPILKEFDDTITIEKRREMYLAIYDKKEQELICVECIFDKC